MTTLISTWAESEVALRKGNTENQQVVRVIETLLNNETTPSTAADYIASIYKPMQNTRHSTNFRTLWGIIATASQTFSGIESELLAELFIAIKDLPDVTNKHGYVFISSGGVVWKDTPDWGWIYWEQGLDLGWYYDAPVDIESDKERWYDQAPGKLNSTTFAATLLARTGDMWYHASGAMEEALERTYDAGTATFIRDGKEIVWWPNRELEGEWKMYIPPAVEWFLVAGEKLCEYSFCESPDEQMKAERKDWKWGERIFSRERWMFWKTRFRELGEWHEVDERCKGLMRRAVEKMEALEAAFGYVELEKTSLEGGLIFPENSAQEGKKETAR